MFEQKIAALSHKSSGWPDPWLVIYALLLGGCKSLMDFLI